MHCSPLPPFVLPSTIDPHWQFARHRQKIDRFDADSSRGIVQCQLIGERVGPGPIISMELARLFLIERVASVERENDDGIANQ